VLPWPGGGSLTPLDPPAPDPPVVLALPDGDWLATAPPPLLDPPPDPLPDGDWLATAPPPLLDPPPDPLPDGDWLATAAPPLLDPLPDPPWPDPPPPDPLPPPEGTFALAAPPDPPVPDPVPLPNPLPPADAGTDPFDPPLDPPVSAPPPELPVGPLPFEDPSVLPPEFGSRVCDDLPEAKPHGPDSAFWCGDADPLDSGSVVQEDRTPLVSGRVASPTHWLADRRNSPRFLTIHVPGFPLEVLGLSAEPSLPPSCAPVPPARARVSGLRALVGSSPGSVALRPALRPVVDNVWTCLVWLRSLRIGLASSEPMETSRTVRITAMLRYRRVKSRPPSATRPTNKGPVALRPWVAPGLPFSLRDQDPSSERPWRSVLTPLLYRSTREANNRGDQK
jgi:hypothetical protein